MCCDPTASSWMTAAASLDLSKATCAPAQNTHSVHCSGEWDAFMGSLRTTLPTTFRINGSGKFAEDLRTRLETDFLASFTSGPVKVCV